MPRLRIPNDWRPRDYQLNAWRALESGGKRLALVWHRRAGKDDIALHWTATQVHERPATYWHMLPEYAQGRKAIWQAVNPHTGKRRIDEAFPPPARRRTDSQTMTIEFKSGAMWHVVGSDSYDRLVGSPPAGVVMSEWALADPAAWAYLAPILAENGGWAIFIYTSRGRNHGYTLYNRARAADNWFAELLTVDDTKAFTAEALAEQRAEYQALYGRDHGEMLFRQEYYCSFEGGLLGAYYTREIERMRKERRVGRVPVDRGILVHTAWDLGHTDSTAIWFIQAAGLEVRLIDYYEASGVGFDHYAQVLEAKRKAGGYQYGTHYFPHDIKAHEVSTGMSRMRTLHDLGLVPTVVPMHNVNDGINAVRRLLDRCWIDEERCERGLECLAQYQREWDERNKIFRPQPTHDWASHGADALRTFAAAWPATAVDLPLDRHRAAHGRRRAKPDSWMTA